MLKQLFLYFSIFFCFLSQAQNPIEKQKVLFVLDASGSMEVMWGSENKMVIAKNTLLSLVDSIYKTNPNIEVGLRVFGHQYHRSLNNCKDSKLEIPFDNNGIEDFKAKLKTIKPNGHTPIAYSLTESAKDFTDEEDAINSIILITDGLENCNGNTCDAAKYLNEKRITINPFIIGLDIADSLVNSFDCIGTFINAKDKETLQKVLKNTVQKATGKTSLSIHISSKGNQEITNTPISIIDPISKDVLYTYIHTLSKKGLPDTLFLDPRGYYQVKIHSYTTITSESFQLQPGVHNNLNMTLPKSYLDFSHEKQYDEVHARFILKQNGAWVYNYQLEDLPLLASTYQISTDLVPLQNENITLVADKVYMKPYPSNGKLSIELNQNIRASIYVHDEDTWRFAYDLNVMESDYTMKLQPGNYSLIYIFDEETNSDNTHRYDFVINEERTTVIKLR